MVYLVMLFNAIYRFCEKWSHRLRGHMLVTVDGDSAWALDVYSDHGTLWADLCDGRRWLLIREADTTITGA